jgi:RimJ/RimL family protein N-acetyltransferase
VVEPLAPANFEMVAAWISDNSINQWLTSEWRNRKVDSVVIGIAVRNKRNRLFLVSSEGQPCGLVALADWEQADKVAMIWYLLGESRLGGGGIISDAVQQLARLAFDDLGIHVLYAWVMEDNTRSRRVLEKVGFREMGHLRSGVCHDGRRMDRIYFDLTKADI